MNVNMKFKQFLSASILVSSSICAHTADLGVGLQLNNAYSTTVYFPIDFEGYRIEPVVSHVWGESTTYYKSNALGLGLFKVASAAENTKVFYGARVAYSLSEYNTSGYVKTKAYTFSPTLGFEYYFNDRFAIGGEIYLQYAADDSTATNSKGTTTGSMAMLKYFFR